MCVCVCSCCSLVHTHTHTQIRSITFSCWNRMFLSFRTECVRFVRNCKSDSFFWVQSFRAAPQVLEDFSLTRTISVPLISVDGSARYVHVEFLLETVALAQFCHVLLHHTSMKHWTNSFSSLSLSLPLLISLLISKPSSLHYFPPLYLHLSSSFSGTWSSPSTQPVCCWTSCLCSGSCQRR